jgi:hypothetical protein
MFEAVVTTMQQTLPVGMSNYLMVAELWSDNRPWCDADIVMNRPLEDIMWLLPGGKARYHQVPRAAHATWWRATSELLKNNTCLGPDYDKPHVSHGCQQPASTTTRQSACTARASVLMSMPVRIWHCPRLIHTSLAGSKPAQPSAWWLL